MPKKALTGKQYKTQKQQYKTQRSLLRGEHAPTTDLQQLMNQYNLAGQGAEKEFAPIRENALSQYNRYTQPEVAASFGGGGEQRSSSLNQALAAARTNLEAQLAEQFTGFKNQYASNLLGLSEQNKTNQMNTLAGLSRGGLADAPTYLPSSKGPNRTQGAIGGAIQGGLQGLAIGGPWGGLAGLGVGGVAGYAGAQGDYSQLAKAGGNYLQNKFSPVSNSTTSLGGVNNLGA